MTNLLLNHLWRLAPRMPVVRKLTFFIAFAFFPLISRAANITLPGIFTADDNVQLFSVSLAAPAAVDFRSYGYGGGTTSTGTVVPRGGFETILTLFSSSGVFLDENDDGAGVAEDPSTGLAGDARITANLAAGNYILALTQFDNFSIGDLAEGFARTGNPNFTADPSFAAGGPCPGNMFRDISVTDGRCRSGNWTLEFVNVASAMPAPEPSALLLLAAGGLALLLANRLRGRKKEILLAAILFIALATSPVKAQTNPDFTNVHDILHGNRTLLQISDLQIVTWPVSTNTSNLFTFNQLLTSNSSVTNTSSFQADVGSVWNPYGVKSFSGLMFNQPQPVIVMEVLAGNIDSFNYLLTTNIQNAGPWFSRAPNASGAVFTAGAMADFNADGYDDFAFSVSDGSIQIATAGDVNNAWAGSDGPFNLGPVTPLDVLTDMTAGDFKGDGQHEIAGLSFTAGGGLQLVDCR